MRILALLLAAGLSAFAQNHVRVSQIYGGGGNSGATLRNDFIELYNPGAAAVPLSGWSVQYASATGSTWAKTDLTGSIPAGGYYLIQEAQGAGGTTNLPAPDATGNIAMSATAGKVALVNNTTLLTGACPTSAVIIDFVGYGTTANCFEGAGPTPNLSNTTAALRAAAGATDTNSNVADFATGAPNPRNSGSTPPPTTCTPTHTISQIQGSGSTSPFAGTNVAVEGTVTALRSNGFFLQMPTPGDNNPATSDGLFIFTSSAPPTAATVGSTVCVAGPLIEFRPTSDPASPSITEISAPTTVVSIATAQPLPPPVPLSYSACGLSGLDVLECLEGMRVSAAQLNVVAPTSGNINEANATATSNGVFYTVLPGTPRPFREPGIAASDILPPGAPCCIPRFDENPERLRVDSDAQPGALQINVATGATVTNILGVLDFGFRTWTVLPDPGSAPVASGGMTPVFAADPATAEIIVAGANLQRFYDTVDDPALGDVVLTPAALANRLTKVSNVIRNALKLPDVLGVVEVENLSVLQAIAQRVNADAAGANPNYQAFLVEGNDPGGIDVGFLVKTSRVTVVSVVQIGATATYINPNNGQPDLIFDRPPLVLRATATRPGSDSPLAFTVIVNHLRSLNGIDDAADGARVRAKRRAGAEYLAMELQSRQSAGEHVLTLGDFNAFEFSDGYVDVMGTISGTPTPANQVVLASSDLVNPDYLNLAFRLPPAERYSYSFDGNAQILDHALVNTRLNPRVSRFLYAHTNADFPEILRNDSTRPERLSDHDMPVAYLALPLEVTSRATIFRSGYTVNMGTRTFTGTVRITNNTGSPVAGPLYYVARNLPAGVTLANATGVTPEGHPYILIPQGLAAGQLTTITVRFTSSPGLIAPSYTPAVYSENF